MYVDKAISYTVAPTSLKGWTRQLLRWKRSFIRESFLCLRFSMVKRPLLFFETFFNLVVRVLFVGVRVIFIVLCITNPLFLLVSIPAILVVAFIRSLPMYFEQGIGKLRYAFGYSLLYTFVFYWLYFIALATFKNSKWNTR